MHPTKYLKYFNLFSLFDTKRTRDILKVNQTINTQRTDATTVTVDVYEYTPETLEFHHFENIQEACTFEKNTKTTFHGYPIIDEWFKSTSRSCKIVENGWKTSKQSRIKTHYCPC